MTRTRVLMTAALFGLLAACSTASQSSLTYAKPGVDTVGRQRDENACLRAASGLDWNCSSARSASCERWVSLPATLTVVPMSPESRICSRI